MHNCSISRKQLFEIIFCVMVSCSALMWLIGLFVGGQDASQYDFFFLRCDDLFADFTNLCGYAAERDVYHNLVNGIQEKIYPPLSYVITYCFSRIDIFVPGLLYRESYIFKRFLIILVLGIVFLMILIHCIIYSQIKEKSFLRLWLSLCVTFSSIVVFTIERGNFLLLTLFFCLVYIFWYDSESRIKREIALVSLALATAFKLSPAILGVLLLYEHRYRESIKAVLYGVFFVFFPFLFFKGGLNNIPQMFSNQKLFFELYAGADEYSLNALVSYYVGLLMPSLAKSTILFVVTKVIMIISIVLFVLTAWMHSHKWEKVLSLSLILVIYPQVSQKYALIYFLPPLILFLNEEEKKKEHSC